MIVLIGCEESGVGRRAFVNRGHNAWSVDLQSARDMSPQHLQSDIVHLLEKLPDQSIDIGIFHPECTSVCVAGNRTYADTAERFEQIDWICNLWDLAKLKCKHMAFENPASVIFPYLRRRGADVQYVQPWQHGHMEQKKTGLALHNLPHLKPTKNVFEAMMQLPVAQRERIFHMPPSKTRSRDRSESYSGILGAMADQWGVLEYDL